ncbi:MAG: SEC-C domain-containing protein [Clostridiales bacterium]|nr:SEC-C domain-containing protein [Clostridiales bacterium]
MSYYSTWTQRSENPTNKQLYVQYVNIYYKLEQGAYELILGNYPDNGEYLEGKASELANKLGFNKDTMDIFLGFLEGIKSSLTNGDDLDLENVVDDTDIKLVIDYEKLYYNMRDAKAEWLFKIPSWKKILSDEKMVEIARDYREANIAHAENIGRNDPCPCGSGKKYKKCCGKSA